MKGLPDSVDIEQRSSVSDYNTGRANYAAPASTGEAAHKATSMPAMEPADELPLLVDMMNRVVHITPPNVPSEEDSKIFSDNRRPPPTGHTVDDHLAPGMPMDGMRMNLQAIQAEFAQISPMMLKQYKSELGIPDNNQPLYDQDKMKLVSIHQLKRPGQPGMNAAVDSSMIIRRPMTDSLDQLQQPGGGGPNHHPDERIGTPSINPPMNIMHPNSIMGGLQYRTNNVGSINAGSPQPQSTLDNDSIAPPPSSMLSINGGGPEIIFSSDFITSVANALDDFDASSIFRTDNDIDFERGFEQWFYNGHPPSTSAPSNDSDTLTTFSSPPMLVTNGGMSTDLFSTDFISSVASTLEDFDASRVFRPDGDINFERDYGQWFNGDDSGEFNEAYDRG